MKKSSNSRNLRLKRKNSRKSNVKLGNKNLKKLKEILLKYSLDLRNAS